MNRRGVFRGLRIIVMVLMAGLLWFGAVDIGWADMRIVEETDGVRTETFYANNRIAMPMPDGSKTMFLCDVGEFVVVGSPRVGRYWQGTLEEVQASVAQLFGVDEADDEDMGEMEALGALFGSLFGGGDDDGDVSVRVRRSGEDTVAGYEAIHYIVQTRNDGNWEVHEELWMSSALLREMASEVGLCVDVMMELQGELMSSFTTGMTELDEVMQSPEYQALWEEGFPVRRKDIMSFFGMTFETVTEVVEVSREPIPADVFAVPSHYERTDHFLQVVDFGDL